ncbi:MAG: hypothetical protein OES13_03530 [Acidimicrobiia bacterium]|nr:hypothetical protein [Acidimicrobiia bacterium]
MRHLTHLVRRFLWTLRAKPLTPREQAEAEGLLTVAERSLFWSQPPEDQRHGLEGARHVLRERPGDRSVARAALLHDVGKRHARLGVFGRSLASGLGLIGIRPKRWRPYYDHGRVGAEELRSAAAEDIVVEWSRAHSGRQRPQSISVADWASLIDADGA